MSKTEKAAAARRRDLADSEPGRRLNELVRMLRLFRKHAGLWLRNHPPRCRCPYCRRCLPREARRELAGVRWAVALGHDSLRCLVPWDEEEVREVQIEALASLPCAAPAADEPAVADGPESPDREARP